MLHWKPFSNDLWSVLGYGLELEFLIIFQKCLILCVFPFFLPFFLAEDAGEYKCRVDFRKSRSEYRSIHLQVYVAPKEVIIMDEFGQRLSDPVGPFNQGAHLNLICEAEGGK